MPLLQLVQKYERPMENGVIIWDDIGHPKFTFHVPGEYLGEISNCPPN